MLEYLEFQIKHIENELKYSLSNHNWLIGKLETYNEILLVLKVLE